MDRSISGWYGLRWEWMNDLWPLLLVLVESGDGRFGMKMLLRAKILIFVFAPLFSPALVREREFTFKLTAIHTAHTSLNAKEFLPYV